MNKLKVVSIGGFGHSVFVFDEMQGMTEAELVGLCPAYEGEDIAFFKNHALAANVPVFYDDEEMIRRTGAKAAIISTRLDMITQVAERAARLGCHLICEKPLAIDHSRLSRLYQTVKECDVNMLGMFTFRNEEPFRAARDIYASGDIGQAVLVNAQKSYKWGASRPEWFGDRALYGGTIGWVSIHAFDFINFVTGLNFTDVAAMQGNFAHPERKDCEDNCAICFGLSNGGHGTISTDLLRPMCAQTHGDDWLRVVGTKGVLEVRCNSKTCTVTCEGKGVFEASFPSRGYMFRDFLLGIANGKRDLPGMKEAFMLTDACLCARDSADSKSFLKIDNHKWE